MKFPPTYSKTQKITDLLRELDVLKEAFSLVPIPQQTITSLRRISLLKSSLFSARIEGNPLTISDVSSSPNDPTSDQHKREVANIVLALNFLDTKKPKKITKDLLKKLHKIVLTGLSAETGYFRREESAIFNQAGVAVYLTPAPQKILELLDGWSQYCNKTTDVAPIKAAVAHIWFEKIHPFIDGNGRVGRLVTTALLTKGGYDFAGIVPFEEYLDNHRQDYYDALGKDIQDVSIFVEFFLEALLSQAKKSLDDLKNPTQPQSSNLLPRRQEILNIIKDHQIVSFDFLSRRFRAVPSSTLHYDLKQLMKSGLIKKLGSTRGANYSPNE